MPVEEQVANAQTEESVAAVAPAIAPAPEAAAKPPEPAKPAGEPIVTPEAYKNLQRQLAKYEREVATFKTATVDRKADERLAKLEGSIAKILDNLAGTDEASKAYQEAEAKRRGAEAFDDYNRQARDAQDSVRELLREHGENPDDPKFKEAFDAESIWDAPKKVAAVLLKIHKEEKANMSEIEALKAKIAKLEGDAVKAGLGDVDMTPGNSGGGDTYTRSQVTAMQAQIAHENDPKRRAELSKKIDDAWIGGRIK